MISCFGSAGDLFPLVPIARELQARRHEVRFLTPRPLGIYLRLLGLPAWPIGEALEFSALRDPLAVTTRFGGWASWRRTLDAYIRPTLDVDVARAQQVINEWRPDVLVAGSLSIAARIAAGRERLPIIGLSIYPQHQRPRRSAAFALRLRHVVASLLDTDHQNPSVSRAIWGDEESTHFLHDPALLVGDASATSRCLGFTYWDAAPYDAKDLSRIQDWYVPEAPTLLVTLGSFLGASQRRTWTAARAAVERLRIRAIFVGPRNRDSAAALGDSPYVLSVKYVPNTLILPTVDAVAHHGGVGTMFGTLMHGRPAIVLPLAYDQPYNARLVHRAGVGVDATRMALDAAIELVLGSDTFRRRTQAVSHSLISPNDATNRSTDLILSRASK